MSDFDQINKKTIKETLKKKFKEKLKNELLEEVYNEIKLEENELIDEVYSLLNDKLFSKALSENESLIEDKEELEIQAENDTKIDYEKVQVSVQSILKFSSHALRYANSNIPHEDWVEVIGLLAGKLDEKRDILFVEDIYPMGHGNAIHAEIKDYNNFARAFNDIKEKGLFICGWYHSHPSYGTFMSSEDMGTQYRYQKLWNKAIALVVDPYQIDGKSYGFEVFRAELKKQKWYRVPFGIKGNLNVSILPELLEFINPIVDGRALYLEYDED